MVITIDIHALAHLRAHSVHCTHTRTHAHTTLRMINCHRISSTWSYYIQFIKLIRHQNKTHTLTYMHQIVMYSIDYINRANYHILILCVYCVVWTVWTVWTHDFRKRTPIYFFGPIRVFIWIFCAVCLFC